MLPDVERRIGGGFTFAETVIGALEELRSESRHEFVVYASPGAYRGRMPLRTKPRAGLRRAHKGVVRTMRAFQDFSGLAGPRSKTWFERAAERDGIEAAWFVTWQAEDCDIPYIFTVFDFAYLECPWFPEVSHGGEWERRHNYFSRFLAKATGVIVPNEAGAEQLERWFRVPADRILRLPHPTPAFAWSSAPDGGSEETLARFGIEEPYLFYPAQFWPHKNHVALVEAIGELRERGHAYQAVCVGSDRGNLGHVLETAERLGVGDALKVLGFVDTPDLVSLYLHAYALVYPSYFGPENLPPLEAFAVGCPVIAVDVPGAREQLGDAALLVDPMDPIQLASAVDRLDDQSLRDDLVRRGRAKAEASAPQDYVRGVLRFLDRFEQVRRCWP